MTTPNRRDLRRLAMQVLYQLDMTTLKPKPGEEGQTAPTSTEVARGVAGTVPGANELAESLDEEHDSLQTRRFAAKLALQAWADHTAADEQVAALAPSWPTHRQPPVDRAILRLAYYEMSSGYAPIKVAINEAIELAKQFGSEHSPPFINGVLDKLAKTINAPKPSGIAGEAQPPVNEPADADAWLDDAMEN